MIANLGIAVKGFSENFFSRGSRVVGDVSNITISGKGRQGVFPVFFIRLSHEGNRIAFFFPLINMHSSEGNDLRERS